MQERYNKALNHFYQAQTNKYMKLEDGSDANDSEVSVDEDAKFSFSVTPSGDEISLQAANNNGLLPPNRGKKKAKVIPVQPSGICTKRFCLYFLIWVLLFVLSVVGLTYFIQKILDKVNVGSSSEKYFRGRYEIFYNRTQYKDKLALSSFNTQQYKDIKRVPCNDFKTKLVWHNTFDKLTTETAVRRVDVNLDGVDDFIIVFGTGVDGYNVPPSVCKLYFPNVYPCFGGALAVDGQDGTELWRHYTQHEAFAVNCNGDLNQDGVPDCLIGGRGSTFEAISGKDGKAIWKFKNKEKDIDVMNLYTAQFIRDLDGDGIQDVLQAYGGDPISEAYSKNRLVGRFVIFSGKTGKILRMEETPDRKETYFSPVVYTLKNGTEVMIFGTGGETHSGGLWVIPLLHFFTNGLKNARKIFTDKKKGLMNPPVLVDINKDGQVDIVMSAFSETIIALDGSTFQQIWRTNFNLSETYSVPGTGYFNEDDIVDFMVKYNHGEGFPVYYYSNITILDGRNGKPITKGLKTSGAANSSPLSVSVEGLGNDLFVYWIADCIGHEGEGGEFHFVEGTNVHEQSRADTCKLRYKTKSFSKLNVMNRKTGFPGVSIYNSEDNIAIEYGERNPKRRKKRHIGVPDHGGFQRIISTGTLAPPLVTTNEDGNALNAVDVLFAVFWIYPAKVRLMVENVWACVKKYRADAKLGKVQNEIDVDKNRLAGHYDEGDTAVDHCLKINNVTDDDKERLYNSQSTYNPNNVHMGKMTFYRYRIECQCKNMKPSERCAKILPIENQGWAGYMGSLANGYYNEDALAKKIRFSSAR